MELSEQRCQGRGSQDDDQESPIIIVTCCLLSHCWKKNMITSKIPTLLLATWRHLWILEVQHLPPVLLVSEPFDPSKNTPHP